MLQQLPELLKGSCSNRWDCCYEQRVAAVAGIAVMERVAAIAGIAVTNRVAAIAGIAVTSRRLQQLLGLLLRAQGCGKCWPCRSKALRQKLNTAVSNDGGRR